MTDWSNDLVLKALQTLEEPVGSLVRAFPGRAAAADDAGWIDKWFLDLVRRIAAGHGPDPKTIIASAAEESVLSRLAKPPVELPVRLISLRPQFFRGFRAVAMPIQLDADLVAIEGRNSSGKTSVSEAIEWVLTGQLSRRTSGEHGHASELADCIGNEFRPEGQDTLVELTVRVGDEPLHLKRILRRDYSKTATEQPLSELLVNGVVIGSDKEVELKDKLFAGVHPILMQHNLRRFVHDDPTSRRRYFERLLQIDELTGLIEKAVIGPTRLVQITNPQGGMGLNALRSLISELEKDSQTAPSAMHLKGVEKLKSSEVPDALTSALVKVGNERFAGELGPGKTFSECRDILGDAQRIQREAKLPVLGLLEQARAHSAPTIDPVRQALDQFKAAASDLTKAGSAAASLTKAQQEVARAVERLTENSLIDTNTSTPQTCPVCAHPAPTLTPARVKEITSWTPLARVMRDAEAKLQTMQGALGQEIDRLRTVVQAVVPSVPSTADVEKQLVGASQRVIGLTRTALASAAEVKKKISEIDKALGAITDALRDQKSLADGVINGLATGLGLLQPVLSSHRDDVAHLEEAVGAASRDDSLYRLREKWLDLAGLTTGVAEDVAWERAKTTAKISLDGLREGLIALRTAIIEGARQTFSEEMTKVWQLLRSDSGAQFSRLSVPPARGKGYKLEFELKAIISDGSENPEVDALRVFSESQINVVGLAAYITRANLLGHKVLIFDDPVQSMDEEHFRSFAANLLPTLLDQGIQVVILTHSDTFARRLNDHHYDRASYLTLETRAGKRQGCEVLEGNRRVSERLRNARKKASEGELQEAWRFIRLAMERLYTLAYAKANPKFDPETWRNATAEDMWKKGVKEIVEKAVPGSAVRLGEIATATAAGAHDKAATSETDVADATKYLAGLLEPLRLGAG
jgi:hypothetical protein